MISFITSITSGVIYHASDTYFITSHYMDMICIDSCGCWSEDLLWSVMTQTIRTLISFITEIMCDLSRHVSDTHVITLYTHDLYRLMWRLKWRSVRSDVVVHLWWEFWLPKYAFHILRNNIRYIWIFMNCALRGVVKKTTYITLCWMIQS